MLFLNLSAILVLVLFFLKRTKTNKNRETLDTQGTLHLKILCKKYFIKLFHKEEFNFQVLICIQIIQKNKVVAWRIFEGYLEILSLFILLRLRSRIDSMETVEIQRVSRHLVNVIVNMIQDVFQVFFESTFRQKSGESAKSSIITFIVSLSISTSDDLSRLTKDFIDRTLAQIFIWSKLIYKICDQKNFFALWEKFSPSKSWTITLLSMSTWMGCSFKNIKVSAAHCSRSWNHIFAEGDQENDFWQNSEAKTCSFFDGDNSHR